MVNDHNIYLSHLRLITDFCFGQSVIHLYCQSAFFSPLFLYYAPGLLRVTGPHGVIYATVINLHTRGSYQTCWMLYCGAQIFM